jgi:group I intron endonuclease
MNQIKSGIYIWKNKITGRVLVGQTQDFEVRKKKYLNKLRNGYYKNNHFQSSWNKHGEHNFEFIVLQQVENLKFLTSYEQSYLDYYRSLNTGVYNQKGPCDCPCRGIKHTPEQNKAKSIRYMGNRNPMFGKQCYNRGKHLSNNTKNKLSKTRKSLKIKLSDSHKLAILTAKRKSVEGIHCVTGEVLEFKAAKDAEALGFKATSIRRCIRGLRTSHRNYYWQYL